MKLILPSPLRSARQWFSAGLCTPFFKLPELTYLVAFTLTRQYRKLNLNDVQLQKLEQNFLQGARHYSARWGQAFCSAFGVDIQVETRLSQPIMQNERVLYVLLNQQSILEIPVLCSFFHPQRSLPYGFVFQNIEFALLPFVGWNSALVGIVIRRGVRQSTQAGVNQLLTRMKIFNDSFYVSVEGQRSQNGQLNQFKKGAAIMAIESQSDIVPISFENAGQLWPYGHWQIRSGQVKIILHDRISTKGLTLSDKDLLTRQLREIAEKELQR